MRSEHRGEGRPWVGASMGVIIAAVPSETIAMTPRPLLYSLKGDR
jgi:hypothetical protein